MPAERYGTKTALVVSVDWPMPQTRVCKCRVKDHNIFDSLQQPPTPPGQCSCFCRVFPPAAGKSALPSVQAFFERSDHIIQSVHCPLCAPSLL
mmetsp:Transcript_48351/g.78779  ORF Transcript_48351/g.78779 Transcript_48351/m.78779 type:complete len:93 (-) Transcript_48351:865-1143(-)